MEGMYKVCDVKLTYNTKVKSSERAVIKDSNSAYSLLMNHIYDSETIQYREYMKLILLNNAKRVLGCNKQILNRHFSVKLNRHMIFETLRL